MAIVTPLTRSFDRKSFESGVITLDDFLHTQAMQYQDRRIGRTFVLHEPESTTILGYYTLASSEITRKALPEKQSKRLPGHPVPCVRLCRLAVDSRHRGKGLGEQLLRDALRRCLALSEQLGVHAILVDALDAKAADFYRKFEFIATDGNPLLLFLPIDTVAKANED
jgi:GNAT superfamily N-acetyltransferase